MKRKYIIEKKKIISIITFLIMIINIGIFAIPMFSQSASFQPEGSITLGLSPGVVWQDNFNPWNSPAAPGGMIYLIYEPLALVNYLTGQIIPWLATNWTFVQTYVYENKSGNIVKVPTLGLILNLRHDVYFTDGTPFNATAVWYTIALEQAYPQLGYLAGYVSNMTIINPYTIELAFNPNNPFVNPTILFAVLEQFVVDPAQWGQYFPVQQLPNGTYVGLNKTGNPFTWSVTNPIGTGPYMLYSFTPQEIVLIANPHYWMPGEPRIKEVIYPSYSSNVQADTALNNGQIIWGGYFEPDVQQNFVAKDPAYYHYYFAPGIPVTLTLNDLKWPLSDPVLRQAISLAINRTALDYLGEYGYEPPATALPLPQQQLSILNSTVLQMVEQYSPPQGNVTAALQLLESHGYKIVNGQLIAPNGTAVPPMTIVAPAAYTDWVADISLIAQQLKQIGLTVEVQTPPPTVYLTDMEYGNYWMGLYWPSSGPTVAQEFATYLYNDWNSSGNITPIGDLAVYNIERLNLSIIHPSFETLINWAEDNFSVNNTAYTNIVNQLAALWIKYMPSIGLMYGAEWYEYINSTVTGWPTPQNYYWIATPYTPLPSTALPIILALHLVNQSVPMPWWYYTSQVPASWYTSNDPFVYQQTQTTTSTSTVTSTTTSTVTSTTTSTTTSTSTVTSTVTKSNNTVLYIAIAVIVIIIVIAAVVLGLRRR